MTAKTERADAIPLDPGVEGRRREANATQETRSHRPWDKEASARAVTSMKENELAPEQVVEPLVASKATDGLGQMELPIAEAMRDADPVMGEASDAGVGSGSVDTQTRRLDFWSTSRDSGPTATVSYRRRRPYVAPDASTENVAPEASGEAAAEA